MCYIHKYGMPVFFFVFFLPLLKPADTVYLKSLTIFSSRQGKFHQSIFHKHSKIGILYLIEKKNWLKCPCCSINQHSCHIDGNMKLYRYKSSGR